MSEPSEYLRPREVAKRLRVQPHTIYRLLRSGELEGVKVGGAIRIPVTALQNLPHCKEETRNDGLSVV